MLIEKHQRVRDKEWKAKVRRLPCLRSLTSHNVVCAHVSKGTDAGKAIKASDSNIVPLTWENHDKQHILGELAFYGGTLGVWKAIDCANELYKNRDKSIQELREIVAKWHVRIWHESKD
jgi:hypothetical protein